MTTVAAYPPEVALLIDALIAGFREALDDDIVGVYLTGSLALGTFDPETSDVDVLVATKRPLSETQVAALGTLHERLPLEENEFGRAYEVYYIDRDTLRRFEWGQRHVKAGIDEEFGWKLHRANWVFERWTLREHGIIVAGPDPKTLIDPVSPDDLRKAARDELLIRIADWAREWGDGENPAPWIARLACQAFEIITVCRALYTAESGELSSKDAAIEWGLRELPYEWRPLVEWAADHRADKSEDTARVPEIIRFVHWAVAETE